MKEDTKTERPDYEELKRMNLAISLHAKRKELSEAMAVFEEAVSKGWANTHSYAGAINCNIRCGDLGKARSLFESLKSKKGLKADVVHYTTMMKGYCEIGDMASAAQLLEDMKIRRVEANVRTMNTFLRGCVQTGDIEKAEILLAVMSKDFKVQPDVSSWEYLITLLSQGLRTDKILPILGRLKNDAEMARGLGSMYISLARSSALLGDWKVSRRAIGQAKEAIKADEDSELSAVTAAIGGEGTNSKTAKQEAVGGKRAWKNGDGGENDTRAQSLVLFREHKIAEQRQDLGLIEEFVERKHKEQLARQGAKPDADSTLLSHFRRVLSFAQGGGDAESDSVGEEEDTSASLTAAALHRFGLDAYVAKCCEGGAAAPTQSPSKANTAPAQNKDEEKNKKNKKGFKKKKKEEKVSEASAVPIAPAWQQRIADHYTGCLDSHGHIDFDHIFSIEDGASPKNSSDALLKLEICSGAGEWAVAQAVHDTASRYATLELRHDRVYSTFYRSVCAQTNNLCVIGGDAVSVLSRRIADRSVNNIFINHPEPPQQHSNQGSQSQGRHLLTTDFLSTVASKLCTDGMLTIVTDNAWYARFLMRQLGAAPHPRALVNVDVASSSSTLKETENEGGYSVYLGKPDASCGYSTDASSYFDRLWKRGNLVDRYVLVLKRKSAEDVSGLRIRQYKKGSAPTDISAHAPKAKKIKFDD